MYYFNKIGKWLLICFLGYTVMASLYAQDTVNSISKFNEKPILLDSQYQKQFSLIINEQTEFYTFFTISHVKLGLQELLISWDISHLVAGDILTAAYKDIIGLGTQRITLKHYNELVLSRYLILGTKNRKGKKYTKKLSKSTDIDIYRGTLINEEDGIFVTEIISRSTVEGTNIDTTLSIDEISNSMNNSENQNSSTKVTLSSNNVIDVVSYREVKIFLQINQLNNLGELIRTSEVQIGRGIEIVSETPKLNTEIEDKSGH